MTTPSVRSRRPRRSRLLAALLALALLAAACGGDDSSETGAEPGNGSTETRTVTHALGTVEVPVDPQRIVSVGYEEQQMILHFGKVPLLQRDYTEGAQPFGTWPWDIEYLEGAEPEIFGGDDIPFERVAALEPDLIMAVNGGLEPDQYERLSEIAPTVAQPVGYGAWDAPGEEQFLLVGAAFGMEEEAQQMLDDTRATLDSIAEAHPEWADLYAASLTIWDPVVNADTTEHVRGQLLEAIGFKPIPDDLLPVEDDYPTVPFEELDELDKIDVLVWMNWEETAQPVLDIPLRTELTAHEEGREVFVPAEYGSAFRILPHSVDYLVEWLVPQLEAAVDADPATPVASSVDAGIAPSA